MKKHLIIALTLLFAAAACTEKEPEAIRKTLTVTPSELSLGYEKTSQLVTVKISSGTWTIEQEDGTSWCSPEFRTGRSSTLKISAAANDGAERTASLVFTSTDCDPVTLTVRQAAYGSTITPVNPGDYKPDEGSGLSFEPEILNADSPCTVLFTPSSTSSVSSQLYKCTDDLYVHIGVYYDEDWKYVPAEWDQNIARCKMEKVGDNSWKLVLTPSIREFFNSGTTPVNRIGIVVRNSDGTRQTTPDQFVSVVDDKYQAEVFVPDALVREAMPGGLRYGINYNADGTVTFVLYDKAKNNFHYDYAYVIGDFSGWKRVKDYMMKRDDAAGCWWYTMAVEDPDKEYMFQYHVGNSTTNLRLADPYSELIYDPWNDKYISASTYPDMPAYPADTKDRIGVFQVNRPGYDWQVTDFRIADDNNVVIYELHLRDFSSTHDLNGALEHLDYLKNLGVNAIELLPVQEFEGNDSWGYNPCSYFAMDKSYGTRDMYRKFIDECHKRGIAVLLDVVYNQATGAQTMARMYWDSAANTTAVNNPWFNVEAPHMYGVFQDWNHSVPAVREFIKRNLVYLLDEYKVDGFRFDLTKGFTQKSGTESSYDQTRVDYLKEYNSAIKAANPYAMVVLEHFVDAENKALGSAGMHMWGNNNYAFTSVVNGANCDLSYMYDPDCYRVGFMESHDEERICAGDIDVSDGVAWGLVGTMTKWAATSDISMAADDVFFVAKNVTLSATDEFKIRKYNDSTWESAYNFGGASDKVKLPTGSAYPLVQGTDSKNMMAPAAGTYDIYFCPDVQTIWLMSTGSRPAVPAIPDKSDARSLKLRRAGLAAAYCLLVPGPKMIWEFGELGYDYSISYGGDRTAAKPVRWDYYDDADRKALYDKYAGILKFRNDNPELFGKSCEFTEYVTTSDFSNGKFMFGLSSGKRFAVMGNFDTVTKPVTVLLPANTAWHDYFNPSNSFSSSTYTETLAPGEFRLLVNFD